ncbi:helicase (plasmid) [Rhodococcus qingshengii]|uniref:helicase-related protein n=1 Tax=Rhodococcus qingshengii TaxID=334542 RepID=UPI0011ED1880|nr:helicase-related protein [Rhodococcus qingshengii]QEM25746.1 helicase [Rhodococcus qingshengii]
MDPHAVPRALVQEVAGADRTPKPSWRSEPISSRQVTKLEELSRQAGKPFEVDLTITKGEAHDLISSILSGNFKEVQLVGRPQGPLLNPPITPTAQPEVEPEADAAQADTVEVDITPPPSPEPADPKTEVTARILAMLAEPDADADLRADPNVNTAEQFLAWAEGHFTGKAQVALADLMTDRQSLSDEMFLACRGVLLDRASWHELGTTAAQAYWQTRTETPVENPTITAVVEAVVTARESDEREVTEDYLETAQHAAQQVIEAAETGVEGTNDEVAAQSETAIAQRENQLEALQEALDLGIAPEIDDWETRAYSLFNPDTPLDLPYPESDPGFSAARRKLKGETARNALDAQWWRGAHRAQNEAVAADIEQLFQEAATSPELIAATGGRDARSASHSHGYQKVFAEVIATLAEDGSPQRQAAAQLINRLPESRTPEWFTEALVTAWKHNHAAELTWSPQVAAEWKSWMHDHLLQDPMIATWAGLPPVTRDWKLQAGIDVAFTVMGEDRPDLVAATTDIPRATLEAELRSDVVPNLYPAGVKPQDRHPVFEESGTLGSSGTTVALRSKKSHSLTYQPSRKFWHYTFDNGGTLHPGGSDHRFALGRVLEAAELPIPEWIERAYRPVDIANRQVLETAVLLARGHELYHVSAHSAPMWRNGNSSFNATGSRLQRFARTQILDDLRRMHPSEMSLLEAQGFDMDWVLLKEVDTPLLEAMHAEGVPAQPMFGNDVIAKAAGPVIVGDPEGTHILLEQSAFNKDAPVTLDGQHYAGVNTWREAIDEARQQLPRKRAAENQSAPLQPQVETTSERAVGETAEVEPEPERAVEAQSVPEPASPTARIPLSGTPAAEAEAVVEADEETTPVPSAENVAADDGVLIVPEELHGEPITSPLWRNGGLVQARKESGATIWISPETAAEYGYQPPQALAEPDTAPIAVVEETTELETTVEEPQPQLQEPAPAPVVAGEDFALGTEVLVPSGAKARVRANIAAAQLVTELTEQGRAATAAEQDVLAQWSGWGAVPEVFDNRPRFKERWASERADLLAVLGERGFAQARETTLNAHYTDPSIVAEVWRSVERAGLPENALILEPGCGAGHFVGTAPAGVNMVGVEIEPISAQIAHQLYPSQQIRNHGFERAFAPDETFSGAIGNVPFGKHGVPDPIHNADGHSLHNQFILKSLALTAPGGYVAVVTSAYTSDARRPDVRKKITADADLVGAVRLPTGAFDRQAKTAVVTDVLIFRRREVGQEPTRETAQWASEAKNIALDVRGKEGEEKKRAEEYGLNAYFVERPERVLGTLALGHGANGNRNLIVEANLRAPLAQQLRRQLDPIVDQALEQGLGFTAPAPTSQVAEAFTSAGLLTDAGLESATIEPGTTRFDEVKGQFEQFKIGQGWTYVNCTGKDKAEQWKVLIALGETVMNITDASRSTESTRDERDALRAQLNSLYDGYVDRWGPINRFTLTEPAPLTEKKIAERLDKAIDRWRIKIGKAEAREEGLPADQARPYTGQVPEDILEEMQEKAATEPVPQKNQSHLKGAIARDPRVGMVLAIETFTSRFDGTDAEAGKSTIFTEDTTPFKERAESAEHVDEAMAISFDELGYISPERMGELLDCEVGDVVDQARGRMFPSLDQPGEWELAETFLSGHVRDKLAAAQRLAAEDPELYGGAVEALERVVPVDVDPANIGVRPGAAWVPMEYYREFLVKEFGLDPAALTTEFDKVSGNWNFKTEQDNRHVNAARGYTDKYGSSRLAGVDMFNLIANNRAIQVLKTPEEELRSPKPRFHPELTAAARSNATALQERFAEWLWSDGERYVKLAATYNELCNSFVKPQYSTEFKSFPGLNPKFTPYKYQTAAVQRFLHDETILLDHVVGAGKTLTMTISCMEAKRLGPVRQPWVVVPNHLLSQWGKDAREAYPNAKILVASELDGIEDRQRFIGQTAVGDWDMVIVPQSVFGLVAMKREAQLEYLDNEIVEMRVALDAANANGSEFSVKQIENAIKATTKRIDAIVAQKSSDEGLSFEQSGCDFLFIDEAHDYKNLSRPSNSADLSVPDGAQRATDLEMKAQFLRNQARERNARAGKPNAPAKAIGFATGTPITNAMSEIWVMTKFLRPDLLTRTGMGRIDNWAGTFAKPVTAVEMNITGTKLRMVTRMAEYANVPQLVAMLDQFRDVVTSDQIEVPLPELDGGVPTILEFDQGQDVIDFVADLDERLGNVKGDAMHIDNSLKISTDGRNVAMHPRLANLPSPPPENSRVEVAADAIWDVHAENADVFIPADKHGPDMTGAFQVVFCDRGTPKVGDSSRARNVYTEMRDALIRRGMKAEEIAFMHNHNSPKAKAKLMEACRDGRIRVLLTSTKKGGTGLNVQRALKQLVNLDPAWTAADMEQRIGRIIRQGNTFDKVSVVNVVARRSYDAMMYQYVARKSAFVAQLRREDLPPTMEDVGGDLSLSWAQTKAAATGDPVFVQQVEAEQKVTMLEAQRNAITNNNAARQATIRSLQSRIEAATERLPGLQEQSAKVQEWLGIEDRTTRIWNFPSGPVPDSEVPDLRDALKESLADAREKVTLKRDFLPIASVNGVPVTLGYSNVLSEFIVDIAGEERYLARDKMTDLFTLDSAANGVIQTLRNQLFSVSNRADALEHQLGRDKAKLEVAISEPELVFNHEAELEAAKLEAHELGLEVNSRENSPDALRQARLDTERRRADGQYPGWSLDLNPTEGWASEQGMTREAVIATVPAKMAEARKEWEENAKAREDNERAQPWQSIDASEVEWRYGFDPNSGMPGARTHWHGRQWNWESWDGTGQHDRGTANKRVDAFARASHSVDEMARERDVPREKIREANVERGAQTRAANAAEQEQANVVDIAPSDQSAAAGVEQPSSVDQSVIDAVKAAGGSHPRKLRDIINNHTPDTEQEPTVNEPTSLVERDYGLDEDGERAV